MQYYNWLSVSVKVVLLFYYFLYKGKNQT